MAVFGEYLRNLRKTAGLSFSQVSKRVGYSISSICELENNRRKCTDPEKLYKILEAVGAADQFLEVMRLMIINRDTIEVRLHELDEADREIVTRIEIRAAKNKLQSKGIQI